MKLLGIISVGFEVTDQLLIRFSAFIRYWKKEKKYEYSERVHQLFIDIKKAQKNTATLIDASKEVDLEVNIEKTEYILLSHNQNAGQN
jgi:hypothetical protein